MRLRVGARSDTGRVRELNEDVYLLRPEEGLFVVCDGMGGCPAGEVASQMAIDAILEQLNGAAQEPSASALAEEQGYAGVLGALGLYLFVILRSLQAARLLAILSCCIIRCGKAQYQNIWPRNCW